MNSTYMLSGLINKKKKLTIIEKTINETFGNALKQLEWTENALKSEHAVDEEKMKNTLQKIVALQNEQIKVAQQIFVSKL